MVVAMAVVGDLVAPRDRGQYQGLFGSVFGVSTVAGPLLGGFFVDSLSWRWIFYFNLPLGLIALSVISSAFQSRQLTVRHPIDYLGTVVLAWLMLGELPSVVQLAGGTLVVTGVVAVRLGDRESGTP